MDSRNKSLLLISVGPKTAPSPSRTSLFQAKPARECSRPVVPQSSACAAAPREDKRASSEQQRSKGGCPIRRFTDQSLFAAPRDLSQRTTSFIASQRQGIHRTPLRHLIALIAKTRSRASDHGGQTSEDEIPFVLCSPSSVVRFPWR
jgi:hypothetical protein